MIAVRTALVAGLALVLLLACGDRASAHEGDPNFRSKIRSVTPAAPGVRLRVLNLDDRLELVNRSRSTVVVEGYEEEAYIRIAPDGTVQVNRNASATYLNSERDGSGDVPPNARRGARPVWRTVSRTGRFEWHDHRMHWMGEGRPPQVRNPGRRTKIFDWAVPLRVGDRPGRIAGTLTWVGGSDGGPPVVAVGSLAVVMLAAAAFVFVVRRRRRGAGGREEGVEAW